ncbi:MAG: TlpA family protein disulfide reductase [Acidobacteria bacterium]|nr:TlpA family protein disulfide reductase [Acidobacteriota bacterium]
MNKRIKTIFNAVLLSVSFALIVVAAAPRAGFAELQDLPKADGSGDAPDMLVDLFNRTPAAKAPKFIKMSSLRGKVTLVDIFWSRCPHCEEHAPHIVEFYNQYKQRGFTVLGLATDRKDNPDDVNSLKSFLDRTKINYPVGFLTGEIRMNYADPKEAGVPQMVLFGADGKMILREIGWSPVQGEKVKKAIEAQLAKSAARAGKK